MMRGCAHSGCSWCAAALLLRDLLFRHARQQQHWGLLSAWTALSLFPGTEGEILLGILKHDSEFRVIPTSSAQLRSVASNALPHQQRNARKVFPRKIILHGSNCTPSGTIACVLWNFPCISPQVASYTSSPWRSWRFNCCLAGSSSEQRKDECRKARAAPGVHACFTASFTNKGGLVVPLSVIGDSKRLSDPGLTASFTRKGGLTLPLSVIGESKRHSDPVLGSSRYSTVHRSAQAGDHAAGSILSSEELLRVLRSARSDRASRKTSSSSSVYSPLGSRPLRHVCLSKSLLHHLRRSSPECYSSLHLYAAAGLPVEPLLPELPRLLLRLLKAGAFTSTRELAICLHACTTLLRKAGLSGERGGPVAAKTTSSVECASHHQSPGDQAAPAEKAGEAWLGVCLACEAEFSRRLCHQFEHTWKYLQRLAISPSPHQSDGWREETPSQEKEVLRNKQSSFLGAPEQQSLTAKNGNPISRQVASSLRGGDSSWTPDGVGGLSPAVQKSQASRDRLSSSKENPVSTGEFNCPEVAASCLDTPFAGGILLCPASSSASRCGGGRSRGSASETAPAWSAVRDDTRISRALGLNASAAQVTDEGMKGAAASRHQTLFPTQAAAGKKFPDPPIPYPHLVVPQDLSMFMSSYVALAKLHRHRVSESLVAAAACYLFLYAHHSSSHAFTLGASAVAKMAAALVAGPAASPPPSSSAAANFSPQSPVQQGAWVLTSACVGPFTAAAALPWVSEGCCRVMGCGAAQSRGTEEISSALASTPPPSVSDTPGKEGDEGGRERPWRWLPQMNFFFSPLQLLAAAVHHWLVEKTDTLRSHDWVCLLHALRYLLLVRGAFPSLGSPALCRVTPDEDRCQKTAGGANALHSVDTASCEKSGGAVGDGTAAAAAAQIGGASLDVRCAAGDGTAAAAAAQIGVASLDAFAAGPTRQGEEAFASASASHRTSIPVTGRCGASSPLLPECAGGSTECSTSQVAIEDVLQGTTQSHIPNPEDASLRAHAAANTLAAARASQRTIAAAAAAFPLPHSLVSPFSEIAAAVCSCFPAWPGVEAQHVLDLYESPNVGSYPLLSRTSLGRDGQSGGHATTPAVPPVPVSSHVGPASVVSVPADGAASIVGPCRLFAGRVESSQAEVTRLHGKLQSALAPPISPPSVDTFLQALRQILLRFQQHLSLSVTLTSLPAVALAVVELHSALIEKVRGLQDYDALWQRPRRPTSRLVPGPCRLLLENQGPERQALSMKSAEMGGELHGGKDGATKGSHTEQLRDRVFCGSRAVSVNRIFGVFAPVYELLCRTRDAERVFNALSANQGSKFSGSVIFLSALVDTLRLADAEHADQNRTRGGARAAAGGGLALRSVSLDTRQGPSPSCCAPALPPLGSAQLAAVSSSEPVCTTHRLRSRVLCLFKYAASNVFLSQPSDSACTSAGSHSLGGSPGTTSLLNVADTSPARCPSAGCDRLAVRNVDVAAQVSRAASGNVSFPRLAWHPTPQDLVDLVEAACFLLSPSDSLDGCDASAPTAEILNASTPGVSPADSNLNADVPSAHGALSSSPIEKDCFPILPETYNRMARTTKEDERHFLFLLLRACCNHVVNVLKSQQEGRMGKNLPEPSEAARPHEGKAGTKLQPRDVSSLAVHFHRCGLFSSAEFDAFGQYVLNGGHVGDGGVPCAAVFSGYDFLCLLQILVRPELPEDFDTNPSSGDGRVPLKERRAQRSSWQSPFAARVAVSMLDGMLPRLIRTFDDVSLARLTLWLGNQFQKLQIYDRCSRSTAPNEHPCSGGSTFGYSRSMGRPMYSGAPAPVDDTSLTTDRIFRLQLPAMRGLLERATRCLVQELVLRFCGLQVRSRSALRVDVSRPSEPSSVSAATKKMFAADCTPSAMTGTVSSAPFRLLPSLAAPPFSSHVLSGDVDRLCRKGQVYVTLLLGLSKLPRDLVLLPESRLAFTELKEHLKANKRRYPESAKFATISAMGAAIVESPMDEGLPPGVLLLHTLLSKHQLEHFFVPCVTLTSWELKVFFSALQHLPLLTAHRSLPNTTGTGKPWRESVCGEHGQLVNCHSRYMREFPTLREHVLRAVFQATPLESLWRCSKV